MPTLNHQLHMLGPVPGTGGRCSKELGDPGPAARSLPGHTQHALIIDTVFANNQCAGGFGEVTMFPGICGAELRCPLVPTFGGRGRGRERPLLSCKMESTKTVVSSQAALVEMNYFVCLFQTHRKVERIQRTPAGL